MKKNNKPIENFTSKNMCEKVKLLRKNQGLTLEDLSTGSGVSRSMLSQIERGQANPTLAVACRIAKAFNVSISDLVDEPWAESAIKVIKSNDPAYIYKSDNQCTIRTLSPLDMEKDIEFYEISIAPNAFIKSSAHFNGTKELLTIQKGSLTITSGTESIKLKKGDSAHYKADIEHSIENLSNSIGIGFLIVTYK